MLAPGPGGDRDDAAGSEHLAAAGQDLGESGDEVLAFVNGMGGTPLIELFGVYNELQHYLRGQGVRIGRQLVGNYMTALEMAGCSITLLKLDDELVKLWDAPVHTPALRWGI